MALESIEPGLEEPSTSAGILLSSEYQTLLESYVQPEQVEEML